jgi:hypothetical protein
VMVRGVENTALPLFAEKHNIAPRDWSPSSSLKYAGFCTSAGKMPKTERFG